MPIVHETEFDDRTLASDVDYAEGIWAKTKGLMGRSSIPDDYALVFPFGSPGRRSIHSLFVRFPIDVVWVVDDEVQRVETLRPWRGLAIATADTVVEFPAGTASEVEPGDTVRIDA